MIQGVGGKELVDTSWYIIQQQTYAYWLLYVLSRVKLPTYV